MSTDQTELVIQDFYKKYIEILENGKTPWGKSLS